MAVRPGVAVTQAHLTMIMKTVGGEIDRIGMGGSENENGVMMIGTAIGIATMTERGIIIDRLARRRLADIKKRRLDPTDNLECLLRMNHLGEMDMKMTGQGKRKGSVKGNAIEG